MVRHFPEDSSFRTNTAADTTRPEDIVAIHVEVAIIVHIGGIIRMF